MGTCCNKDGPEFTAGETNHENIDDLKEDAYRVFAQEGHDDIDGLSSEDRAKAVLAEGSLRLLSACWLNDQEEDFLIARLQELPEEALVPPMEAVEMFTKMFGIVVLSYGWLSQWHPDPDGFHIYYVRVYLQKHMERFENLRDVGIFWDFACLPQSDTDGYERTPSEEWTWQRGLRALSALYGGPRSVVLQLTALPEDPEPLDEDAMFYRSAYMLRGWCFFECTVATLLKDADQLLDLGNALAELEDPSKDWDQVQQRARGWRLPPLTPEDMTVELGNRQFTVGDDVHYLSDTYAQFFEEAASSATWLWFENSNKEAAGWSDEELRQFVRALPSFSQCQAIRLWGHRNLTEEGLAVLTAHLPEQTSLGRLLLPKHLEGTKAGKAMKRSWARAGKAPGSLFWC